MANSNKAVLFETEIRAMPALTLTQPWASLVAMGAKRIETRSWSTNYRGLLAIHAAQGFPGWARDLCDTEPFYGYLKEFGDSAWAEILPRGCVVATAYLHLVVSTNARLLADAITLRGAPYERTFGDYSPNRFAWFLDDIGVVHPPVPAKGALGLWRWEPHG